MRLTESYIKEFLSNNEGFTKTVSYVAKNIKVATTYLIENGELVIQEVGKTSWADSKFDSKVIATIAQARRFIKTHMLNK
ncbi:MAG: hypothetical protein FWC16_06765 [Defluviitaleaceae bacterium]|nr:hypothetical protein [Defluviitaleaceae bacterium]MCL2274612.1 hypothetical protein [Defluviitaleaceae bacterium]